MHFLRKYLLFSFFAALLLSVSLSAQTANTQPTPVQTAFQQGLSSFNAGRFDEAGEFFKKVISLQPNTPAAYFNLGLCHSRQKRNAEALAAFQEAVRVKPDYVEALIQLGNSYDYLGKLDDAVVTYKKALAIEPNNGNAYFELGVAYYGGKKYQEALESLQQSLKFKPESHNTHLKLGQTYAALNRDDEALLSFKEAVRLKPDFSLAFKEMGTSYNRKKNFSQAIAAFQEAIRLVPSYADAHLGLGNSYYNNKQYTEAITPYQAAVKNSPQWATAHEFLADSYYNLKRYTEAKTEYLETLKINPKNTNAVFNLGKTLAWLGDTQGALAQKDALATFDNAKAQELATWLTSIAPKANNAAPDTSMYPTLAKLSAYVPPQKPSEVKDAYDYRLQSNSPVPPTKIDAFICDVWLLMNMDLKLAGIKENIVSVLDVNQVLNFYLTSDFGKLRGYRPWTHQNFVKSLTVEQRKALSQEVVKYMSANGVKEAADAKKIIASTK